MKSKENETSDPPGDPALVRAENNGTHSPPDKGPLTDATVTEDDGPSTSAPAMIADATVVAVAEQGPLPEPEAAAVAVAATAVIADVTVVVAAEPVSPPKAEAAPAIPVVAAPAAAMFADATVVAAGKPVPQPKAEADLSIPSAPVPAPPTIADAPVAEQGSLPEAEAAPAIPDVTVPVAAVIADVTVVAPAEPVPRLEAEKTFLSWQTALRVGGTHVVNEAMLVLDIIDTKTQALLAYIGISLAALIFLLAAPPNMLNLRLGLLSTLVFTTALLLIILILLAASVLCLSCLNIIGAHTIRRLESKKKLSQSEYESLVLRVTNGRRQRYLYAHRLSMVTAVLTFLLFSLLLVASLVDATVDPPLDFPKIPLPRVPTFVDHD
jgi:hypothetical protein